MGRRPGPRLVTLSSDLGPEYSAQVKAVLARSIDPARVVELTHDLPAHAVAESAFVLRAMAQGFPSGTIHLAVVDPGVGGRRAPVAIATAEGSVLVGPDNGLLFPLAETLGRPRAFRLEPGRVGARSRVGATFDARDLFAPAVARLARGARPASLGPRVRPTPYRIPAPARRDARVTGEIVHIDRFGNLITNIPSEWIAPSTRTLEMEVGTRRVTPSWTTHYEATGAGRLAALGSSFGTLEIAVARGRAVDRLGARVGAPVRVRATRPDPAPSQSVNSERPRRR